MPFINIVLLVKYLIITVRRGNHLKRQEKKETQEISESPILPAYPLFSLRNLIIEALSTPETKLILIVDAGGNRTLSKQPGAVLARRFHKVVVWTLPSDF